MINVAAFTFSTARKIKVAKDGGRCDRVSCIASVVFWGIDVVKMMACNCGVVSHEFVTCKGIANGVVVCPNVAEYAAVDEVGVVACVKGGRGASVLVGWKCSASYDSVNDIGWCC